MTGAMPRPSTRLSSREPTPKRRRAPPPLSVTNVFADARVPKGADELWKWPVTSWYFGDVGNADLHITSDRPFINNVTSLPPIEKHYRLKWLEEDANKLVNGEQPTPPEPLPQIPYARQKDTTACARPSRGLGTGVERVSSGRPRKRRCIPTEAPVVEPATINVERENADTDPATNIPHVLHAFPQCPNASADESNATRVASLVPTAKTDSMSVDAKPCQVPYRQPKIPPASNFCTPPLSVQEAISAPSPCETLPCETPLENESTPSLSGEPIQAANDETKKSEHSNRTTSQGEVPQSKEIPKSEDGVLSGDSREEVHLQFASPVEPRLMGTLTYSFSVDAAPEKDDKQVSVVETPSEVKQNTFAEEGICVEGMDLEFRKSNRPFEDAFEDRDITDELRPEILRFNTLLNGLGPKTKPLRNMIHAVVQTEMKRHNQVLAAEAEEIRIIARLKEIEKEKAATKAREKAAQAKAKAAARRASARVGTQGRPRRVSRKILEEPESDDESNHEDDVKIVAERVVAVDKNNPIVERKVVDNRKLLLKPEYKAELEELTSVILNAPQAGVVPEAKPKDDAKVKPHLNHGKPATEVDVTLTDLKPETDPAKVENVSGTAPAIDQVEKACLSKKEPKGLVTQVVKSEEPGPSQIQVLESHAVASVFAAADSVEKDNTATVKDQSSADTAFFDATNSPAEESIQHALTELTNIPSKLLQQEPEKPQVSVPIATTWGESNATLPWYDAEEKTISFGGDLVQREPEAEITTTPITEIDMDATPESDDEAKPKELLGREESELQVDLKSPCEFDSDSQFILQPAEENAPCTVFVKDGRIDEQLVRIPSPVSPLQAATPTCGFVVVPTSNRTKLLTSGSALVNHMKAIHGEAKKSQPTENDS